MVKDHNNRNDQQDDHRNSTDTDTKEDEQPLRLVKGSERSKRRNKQGRLDHSTKLSYWCLGIIVIILLFYFLGTMIGDAENLEDLNKVETQERKLLF